MAFMSCNLRSVGVYCGTPAFIQLKILVKRQLLSSVDFICKGKKENEVFICMNVLAPKCFRGKEK